MWSTSLYIGKEIDVVIPFVPGNWGDEEETKKKGQLLDGLVEKLQKGKKDSEGEAAPLFVKVFFEVFDG